MTGDRRRLGLARLAVACCSVVAAVLLATAAGGETRGAVIEVSPSSTQLGDTLVVRVSGWPRGVVTAAVCGNAARRGSTDCEQVGAGSIGVGASGTEALRVTVLQPPVGCPCVVRASTTNGDTVRTAPISIAGVADGVDLAPVDGLPSADALDVSVHVRSVAVGWPEAWYPAFGGPARRELVFRLHNTGITTLTGLRVVGSVAHDGTQGEPFAQRIGPVAAGATRTIVVPFQLGAPVWGDYRVTGSIYGLAAPVNFAVRMSNEPWALELLLPLGLFALAQVVRRRERARRRAEEIAAAEASGGHAHLLPESSPAVGDSDGSHWDAPAYDLSVMETVGAAAPVDAEQLADLHPPS